MLSVAKLFTFLFGFLLLSFSVNAEPLKDGQILVIGGSISANCNGSKNKSVDGVFQFDLEGNKILAEDPLLWADCTSGSIWVPLGAQLVEQKFYKSVTFMSIGTRGTNLRDWLAGGSQNSKLQNALDVIKRKSIVFDYVFFLMGSADIASTKNSYKNQLTILTKELKKNGILAPWIIAQHSRCYKTSSDEIELAQKEFTQGEFLNGYFLGPNISSIDDDFRRDGCHLNDKGQELAAKLWYESLIKVKKLDMRARKETLIFLFDN